MICFEIIVSEAKFTIGEVFIVIPPILNPLAHTISYIDGSHFLCVDEFNDPFG